MYKIHYSMIDKSISHFSVYHQRHLTTWEYLTFTETHAMMFGNSAIYRTMFETKEEAIYKLLEYYLTSSDEYTTNMVVHEIKNDAVVDITYVLSKEISILKNIYQEIIKYDIYEPTIRLRKFIIENTKRYVTLIGWFPGQGLINIPDHISKLICDLYGQVDFTKIGPRLIIFGCDDKNNMGLFKLLNSENCEVVIYDTKNI